jgi:hypothetical protein
MTEIQEPSFTSKLGWLGYQVHYTSAQEMLERLDVHEGFVNCLLAVAPGVRSDQAHR